jgi:hypothetical protein
LTWKYHYTADGHHSLVADGKPVSDLARVTVYAAQPAATGVRLSEVYAARAREAQRGGQAHMAEAYRVQSEVALRTEIANQQIEAGIALGNALVALGDALAKARIDEVTLSAATATATYFTAGAPRGVIGDQAPAGTVLELYLRLDADPEGWDPLIAKRTFQVIATLRDADGKLWRSAVGLEGYLVQASKPTVPPALEAKYLLVDGNTLIPFREPAAGYIAELGEIARMRPGTMIELALAGAEAIRSLYDQIEASKLPPVAAPSP